MKNKGNVKIDHMYHVLFLYTLAFWFGKELARPTISIALADSETASSMVGMLLSIQNFFPLILSIPLATLGDRKGHDKILNLGSWLTVLSGVCFLLTIIDSLFAVGAVVLLTVGQILSGIAWTVAWISLQTLVSDCDAANRQKGKEANGVNRLILIMSIGMVLGPVSSGWLIDSFGIASVWELNMLLSLVQIGLSLWLKHHCVTEQSQQKEVVHVEENKKQTSLYHQFGGGIYLVMVMFSFIMMFGSEIKSSYMPVVLRGAGISSTIIGYVSSAGALATCLIRVFMNTKKASVFSRKTLIYISMLCSELAFISMVIFPAGKLYLISSILIGLCGGIVEPVLIVIILENTIPQRKGLALTGRVLFNRLAMFLAPSIAGFLVTAFGVRKGFGMLAIMMLIIILVTISGMKICFKGGRTNGKA